jgi:DNA-binding response OmpR family regulator
MVHGDAARDRTPTPDDSVRRILIVDDQPELRELVGITLGGEAFRICYAASGAEALEVARRECPHLVILDVNLSNGMDGYEVCRMIKQDPLISCARVIMLTSLGSEQDKERGFLNGADDYFVKPFSPLELLRKIDEVLD